MDDNAILKAQGGTAYRVSHQVHAAHIMAVKTHTLEHTRTPLLASFVQRSSKIPHLCELVGVRQQLAKREPTAKKNVSLVHTCHLDASGNDLPDGPAACSWIDQVGR